MFIEKCTVILDESKKITMDAVFDFSKRLFESLASTFDLTSDLVNSLDFLGHNVSRKVKDITLSIFSVSNNGSKPLNHLTTQIPFDVTNTPINDSVAGFCHDYNAKLINQTQNDFNKQLVCSSEGNNEHMIWGILGIAIMFMPGLLSSLTYLLAKPKTSNKLRKGKYPHDLIVTLLWLMFPVTVVIFQCYTAFTCQGKVYQGYIAIAVAIEAFLESFLQLTLQTYTIIYGYEITGIQIATICASFFILSTASINLDLEMNSHKLSICNSLLHYAKLVPGYAATVAFRVLSISIAIAFPRIWSIIPMSLLILNWLELTLLVLHRIPNLCHRHCL